MTLVVRAVTVVALGLVAYYHLDLASTYTLIGDRPFSLGDQFYAQSAAAILLAVAVLAPLAVERLRATVLSQLVWLGIALFAVVSLVPLVYSRYNPLPIKGFPGGWQETWDATHAVQTAWVESVLVVVALAGLVLERRAAARAA